jgi:hypothetical protein
LPNNGTDMCAAWTTLMAGYPADSVFYIPDGIYYTTCSGGNNVTQTAHFVCQSPGVLNSGKTAIVGGAVFKQQIAFNNAPGSVENCGFDTIASGLAGGTSNNGVVSNGTAGNMTVSGNLYLGCNGTAGCNAAHAYLIQGGPHNRINDNSAYYAYHCAASRSSDTIVNGLYCFDPADVVLKSDTSTGSVNENHFSNITIEMDTTSSTPYGSGAFVVNANNGTQVTGSDVVNLKLIDSPFGIDIDPETGGVISGINFDNVVGLTVGLGIILQTTTTGSATEIHLDNSSFTNIAAFVGFNNAIATGSFYMADTSFKSGTTNGVTNSGIVHASFMPTGRDAWDQMEPHPEIEDQVSNTATASQRYQAPNGVGVNMEAAVQTFGIVTLCGGQAGFNYLFSATAAPRYTQTMAVQACLNKLGGFFSKYLDVAQTVSGTPGMYWSPSDDSHPGDYAWVVDNAARSIHLANLTWAGLLNINLGVLLPHTGTYQWTNYAGIGINFLGPCAGGDTLCYNSTPVGGGGNVNNSGTPAVHQTPIWGDATHLAGAGPGTAGQVWTSGGASADPSFQAPGGGAVSSVFTRTGAVTPQSGDYSFSQISGTVGAGQLPTPGASTLGGVESKDCSALGGLQKINTDGSVSCPASNPDSDLVLKPQSAPPASPATACLAMDLSNGICEYYDSNSGPSLEDTSGNVTRIAQKFFGTAAPGSVTGNLPGDTFSDTANYNDYWCNAGAGTAAPACTSVAVGGWTQLNGVGVGGGLGDPGANGVMTRTSLNVTAPADAAAMAKPMVASLATWTADAYTITLVPALAAQTQVGLRVSFIPSANNTTTTSTAAVSGLAALTMKKKSWAGLVAVAAGDIVSGEIATLELGSIPPGLTLYWVLTNPQTVTSSGVSVAGSSGDLQMNNGSSNLAAAHINDNATTMTVTESITPSVAAANNLGTSALPFGDGYFGNAANQDFHFTTSALTALRAVVVQDAASTIPTTAQEAQLPSSAPLGILRGGSPSTGAEMSGFGTTSGSNALVPGVVATGQTLTIQSGGTLTCAAGSTCPSGSAAHYVDLIAGVLQGAGPSINNSWLNGTSAVGVYSMTGSATTPSQTFPLFSAAGTIGGTGTTLMIGPRTLPSDYVTNANIVLTLGIGDHVDTSGAATFSARYSCQTPPAVIQPTYFTTDYGTGSVTVSGTIDNSVVGTATITPNTGGSPACHAGDQVWYAVYLSAKTATNAVYLNQLYVRY